MTHIRPSSRPPRRPDGARPLPSTVPFRQGAGQGAMACGGGPLYLLNRKSERSSTPRTVLGADPAIEVRETVAVGHPARVLVDLRATRSCSSSAAGHMVPSATPYSARSVPTARTTRAARSSSCAPKRRHRILRRIDARLGAEAGLFGLECSACAGAPLRQTWSPGS